MAISGGVASNVVPDECVIDVNYRFAPDRDEAAAEAHLCEVFAGFVVEVVDSAPGARPGLHHPAAMEFVELVGQPPIGKFGWTDVARFASLGIPAINFGPGDPNLAHKPDEHVEITRIRAGAETLHSWLSGRSASTAQQPGRGVGPDHDGRHESMGHDGRHEATEHEATGHDGRHEATEHDSRHEATGHDGRTETVEPDDAAERHDLREPRQRQPRPIA